MFRLLSMAIFRDYQYLKTFTVLLYSFSTVNGKEYNAYILLKHKRIVLYFNYAKIIKNVRQLLKSTNLYQMLGRCTILKPLCILMIKNYANEII